MQKLSWYSIGFIYTGACIAIPMFFVASSLLHDVGLIGSIITTVIAGIVWMFLGMTMSYFAAQYKQNVFELIETVFGREGGVLLGLIITFLMIGWTAINTNLMVDLLMRYFNPAHPSFYKITLTIISSYLAGYLAIRGIKYITIFGIVSVPILLIGLFFVSYLSIDDLTAKEISLTCTSHQLMACLSYLVGGIAIGYSLTPNLTCLSKSVSDAMVGIVVSVILGATLPLVLAISMVHYTGESDPLIIFVKYKATWFFVPFILLATWSTNDINLYSASLALEKIFKNTSRYTLATILTVLATIFSLTKFFDYFMFWLSSISICVPPMVGVIIAFFLSGQHHSSLKLKVKMISFASYFLGIFVGILTTPRKYGGLEFLQLTDRKSTRLNSSH